eukprot:Em0228g1a
MCVCSSGYTGQYCVDKIVITCDTVPTCIADGNCSLMAANSDQQVAKTCIVSGNCAYSYNLSLDNQVISHTNPVCPFETWKIIVIVINGLLFLFVIICVIIKIILVMLDYVEVKRWEQGLNEANFSKIVPLRVSIRLRIRLDGKSWAVLASAAEAELREWELDKTKVLTSFSSAYVFTPGAIKLASSCCVFSCFEAPDSVANLGIVFRDQAEQLQAMKWSHPVAPQSFSAYCTELQLLQTQKAKYTEAQDELATSEELLNYVATTLGKKNPITRGLYQPDE